MGVARTDRGAGGLSVVGRRRRHQRSGHPGVWSRGMKRTVLALLICACGAHASGIDGIFEPLMDAKSPGAAVLVIKNGRAFFEKGYGVRDLRGMSRIGSGTDFRLASFSKQFTAMAIML